MTGGEKGKYLERLGALSDSSASFLRKQEELFGSGALSSHLAGSSYLQKQEELFRSTALSTRLALSDSSFLRMQENLRRSSLLGFQQALPESSLFRMQELLRSSAFSFQEALNSTFLRVQEEFQRGFLGVQEQLRRSGMFDLQEALRNSPFMSMQDQALQQSLSGIERQMRESGLLGIENALQNSAVASQIASMSDIGGTLSVLRQWTDLVDQETFDDEMLHIGPDGSVTLAGETATSSEVQRAFEAIFSNLANFLTDTRSVLSNLAKPVRALVLWFVNKALVPILLLCLQQQLQQQQHSLEIRELQRYFHRDQVVTRREVVAAVKKYSLTSQDIDRASYRIVTGDRVHVRTGPKRKAPASGLLRLGTIVRLVERRGRWTAIFYLDHDGDIVTGWVFNKYLTRLDK